MHHLVGTVKQTNILLPQRLGKEGEIKYGHQHGGCRLVGRYSVNYLAAHSELSA